MVGTILLSKWYIHNDRSESTLPTQKTGIQKNTKELAAGQSKEAKASSNKLRFSPKNGEVLAYNFEIESNAEIDFSIFAPTGIPGMKPSAQSKQNKTSIKMFAKGEIYLKYYIHNSQNWNAAAKIDKLSFNINGRKPAYAESILFPFGFCMKSTGFLSKFKFSKQIPDETEDFIKQLLYSAQIGFSKESKISWRTRELDMTGQYRALYKVVPPYHEKKFSINKSKLEYINTSIAKSGLNPTVAASKILIEKSNSNFNLTAQSAWFNNLTYNETIRSVIQGREWSKTIYSLTINQIKKDSITVFPKTYAEFLSMLESNKAVKSQYYATDSLFDEMGANLSIDQALELFQHFRESSQNNAGLYAEQFFVNYLRQHPDTAFDLVDILDKDSKREKFDQTTQLILWRLLTEAGHTEAQQAVLDAITNPDRSDLSHIRALGYIHDFDYPETFLMDQLWEYYNGLSLSAFQTDIPGELRTATLYAIGGMGHKDKLNDDIKSLTGKQLVDHLKSSDHIREQAVTLEAIGNYGGSDVLDNIEPYFSHPEEQIRSSAYDSLRRMEDPKAVELLAKSFEKESSFEVKKAALQTLASMPPTNETVELAQKLVMKVDTRKEQLPLVKVLGENLGTHPENVKHLRNVLNNNPDNLVKREIYRYIVPE